MLVIEGRQTSYRSGVEDWKNVSTAGRFDSGTPGVCRSVGPHNYSGTGVWQCFFFALLGLENSEVR